MNPNRSWLIKMKKEKNFKMIFFSIKRNVNISRKIREISLLRKIAYESNFFYACDKLFPVYTCICTRTSKRCDSWNTHKSPIEKEIEKEYRAVVVAQRRGEVEKRNFLCFLLISNSRSSRKRGGTRGEARNLIEVWFHYEGQGEGGRKERLFVL